MAFSKRFPREVKGSPYAAWEEVTLDEKEERRLEEEQRGTNLTLMRECLDDARRLLADEKLKGYETSVVEVAIALFGERARHLVYWKEEAAKRHFDEKFSQTTIERRHQ